MDDAIVMLLAAILGLLLMFFHSDDIKTAKIKPSNQGVGTGEDGQEEVPDSDPGGGQNVFTKKQYYKVMRGSTPVFEGGPIQYYHIVHDNARARIFVRFADYFCSYTYIQKLNAERIIIFTETIIKSVFSDNQLYMLVEGEKVYMFDIASNTMSETQYIGIEKSNDKVNLIYEGGFEITDGQYEDNTKIERLGGLYTLEE